MPKQLTGTSRRAKQKSDTEHFQVDQVHRGEISVIKISQLFKFHPPTLSTLASAVVITLGLTLTGLANASGAFSPPGVGAPSPEYAKGKALFNGGTKIDGAQSCKDCHSGSDRLRRGPLKGLGTGLDKLIVDCSNHKPCYKDKISNEQQDAITTYLKTRYRL